MIEREQEDEDQICFACGANSDRGATASME
jgi:hypothetical protein